MNALSQADLDRIAAKIAKKGPFDGYPTQRLFIDTPGFSVAGHQLFVPFGPWYIKNHPNRLTTGPSCLHPEVPTCAHPKVDQRLSAKWTTEGLMLDQYGRPIHPHWRQLISDRRIGLPTGVGYYYRYGFNRTVDAFVYRVGPGGKVEILIILRKTEKEWALPGGFEDDEDQNKFASAVRELKEETNLDCTEGSCFDVALAQIPIGQKTTLHAWTENTVIVVHANQEYLFDTKPVATDDAIDAKWVDLETAKKIVTFSDHCMYITRSISLIRH
ncbi:MAG: NUDIX domain-containing protein [Candidatus Woesebacteria bacterium]|jgi:8-oxo-dGTP pyrophosphatase MutT (NUDIX family)